LRRIFFNRVDSHTIFLCIIPETIKTEELNRVQRILLHEHADRLIAEDVVYIVESEVVRLMQAGELKDLDKESEKKTKCNLNICPPASGSLVSFDPTLLVNPPQGA
jgi:hypothetical protein